MELTPMVHEPDRGILRRLAERPQTGGKIVSLYLNLDPTMYGTPPARASQITSLVNEAKGRISEMELTHDEREMVLADIEVVRRYLEGSLPANGAAGVAVFCSSASNLFEVLPLPKPVQQSIVIGDSAMLAPLAEFIAKDLWCVLLVNSSSGRILRGTCERLVEVEDVHDDVQGRHSRGGWSQARYERSVEKEIGDHIKGVAERLFALYEADPFDHLVIGTPSHMLPEVERWLHPYLTQRLRGRIDIDVENTGVDDVLPLARPVMEKWEQEREREMLDRLAEELGKGGRATASKPDVLKALEEKRVDVLLLDERADDTGRARDLALAGAANVVVVHHHDDLVQLDSMAALLRY